MESTLIYHTIKGMKEMDWTEIAHETVMKM